MNDIISPRRISLAPMIDWTDLHYRYFLRLISKRIWLYTEMIATGAILHGDKKRHLDFNAEEHPVALQLGGSNPADLAACAKIAEDWGYDEINLNVGCPSSKVQSGMFGACLMAHPELVAECISAMNNAVKIPVTVKTRLGIDEHDSWEFLEKFLTSVKSAGCDTFILHARKAWLKGLSPRENREIPPLDYERVWKVKELWPELEISINGGFRSMDVVEQNLAHVDGVMIGREAYENPFALACVDSRFYGEPDRQLTRKQIFSEMIPYFERRLAEGDHLKRVARHLLGLYHGVDGGRAYRRTLSEGTNNKAGDRAFLLELYDSLPDGI